MLKTSKTKTPRPREGKQTFLTVTAATELCTFLCGHLPEMMSKSVPSLLRHRQVKSRPECGHTPYNHGLRPGDQVCITWTQVLQDRGLQGLKIVFEDPLPDRSRQAAGSALDRHGQGEGADRLPHLERSAQNNRPAPALRHRPSP